MIEIVGFRNSHKFREKECFVKFKKNEKGEEKGKSSCIGGLDMERRSS